MVPGMHSLATEQPLKETRPGMVPILKGLMGKLPGSKRKKEKKEKRRNIPFVQLTKKNITARPCSKAATGAFVHDRAVCANILPEATAS